MDKLLETVVTQIPNLGALIILVVVGVRAALQFKDFITGRDAKQAEVLERMQKRSDDQNDRAWSTMREVSGELATAMKEIRVGCAGTQGSLESHLRENTAAVKEVAAKLDSFHTKDQKGRGSS